MTLPRSWMALMVLGAAQVSAATEPARFRYWKPIALDLAGKDEIVSLEIDSDIFAATRPGLPDLRILDAAQTEVPYQLEQATQRLVERVRQTTPSEVLALREEGKAIEIRARLRKDAPPAEGVQFDTPAMDFERHVHVSGSDDGQNWTPLVADGIIFDYSRYMDVKNADVPLPPNRFRQFKITVEDVTDERESAYRELTRTFRGGLEEARTERATIERRTFRIDQLTFWYHLARERSRKVKKAEYPVAGFEKREDVEHKQTVLAVKTRREPLTGFTLETPSRNFSRRVLVQVPVAQGSETQWREVGAETLCKFEFRSFRRERLTVPFPEQRQAEYRVVICNEDNPPLAVAGVRAEGNVYHAVFLAEATKSYRVFYGSESAEPPKYEAAAVLGTLRQGYQPVPARPGKEQPHAGFGGEPRSVLRDALNNPLLLIAAVCGMVLILGWGLFRAGRRLAALPAEDDRAP